MKRIPVTLESRSYDVLIEQGLLDSAGAHLGGGRIAVVTEENVWAAQGARLQASLEAHGVAAEPIVIAPGEGSKDWQTLIALVDRLLALNIGRGDPIVAFGGGVIGDLAGFAAAILKRGCPLIQIPTSLLAQVDSSVGGKTAINVAAGKNLVGAFHQPALVLIDPSTLATLPAREMRAGYAEIVKYGLIGDPDFFAWCQANGTALLAGDEAARAHAIAACVAAKAGIVAEDERETGGARALLNLGHTFGHAIEAASHYRLLHGEAVALGLALAFRLSAARGLCPRADADEVAAHLGAVGLPARFRDTGFAMDAATLMALIANDKKAVGNRLRLILVTGIGQAFVDDSVAPAGLEAFLAAELSA